MLNLKHVLVFLFILGSFNLTAQDSEQGETVPESDPKSSFENLQKVLSSNKEQMRETIQILKEQLNWDEMFEGKDHLKGDKPEKEDGMEALLNLSLGPMRLMNPRELEQVILEKTTGGPLHSFFATDYKSLSFTVKLLQHPRALPYLGRMIDQKHKFYFFLGFVLITFIGFYIYKRSKFKNRSFLDTIFQRIFLFILATTINIGVLILLFHKELTPIHQLGSTHFN